MNTCRSFTARSGDGGVQPSLSLCRGAWRPWENRVSTWVFFTARMVRCCPVTPATVRAETTDHEVNWLSRASRILALSGVKGNRSASSWGHGPWVGASALSWARSRWAVGVAPRTAVKPGSCAGESLSVVLSDAIARVASRQPTWPAARLSLLVPATICPPLSRP